MTPGREPTDAEIAAFDNATLADHYSMVIGEMSTRHVEKHRDYWGPTEDPAGPLASIDSEELLRIYVAVHAEIMQRHREKPEDWDQVED